MYKLCNKFINIILWWTNVPSGRWHRVLQMEPVRVQNMMLMVQDRSDLSLELTVFGSSRSSGPSREERRLIWKLGTIKSFVRLRRTREERANVQPMEYNAHTYTRTEIYTMPYITNNNTYTKHTNTYSISRTIPPKHFPAHGFAHHILAFCSRFPIVHLAKHRPLQKHNLCAW